MENRKTRGAQNARDAKNDRNLVSQPFLYGISCVDQVETFCNHVLDNRRSADSDR